MKIKTPFGREYRTKQEENEAKIKKRNQTQEWIIGNKFVKSGDIETYRNNQETKSSLKNKLNNNILNNNIKNDNFIYTNDINKSRLLGLNQNPYYQYQNINNNNYQNNLLNIPYMTPLNNVLMYPPPLLDINSHIYPNIYLNNIKSNNNMLLLNNNNKENQFQNNSFQSLIDLDPNKRDMIKKVENEKYRKDLLKQIEENNQRKNIKKKEIEEQNRIDEIKNQEYFILKEKQEEEFERIKKLNKNRKLKSQFTSERNILNSSYDNKSNNQSIDNSDIINQEKIENDAKIQKIEKNYQKIVNGNNVNMFEEKEELKNFIDKEYEDLFKSIEIEIDNQKNYNGNNLLKSVELPIRNYDNLRIINPHSRNNHIIYGNDLKLSNIMNNDRNIFIKNKNKKIKYYLSNNIIQRNVENEYNNIFKKISNIDDLTKSYKIEINPKIYYNNENELDEYYNNYSINTQRYKLKKKDDTNQQNEDKNENIINDNDNDNEIKENDNKNVIDDEKYINEKYGTINEDNKEIKENKDNNNDINNNINEESINENLDNQNITNINEDKENEINDNNEKEEKNENNEISDNLLEKIDNEKDNQNKNELNNINENENKEREINEEEYEEEENGEEEDMNNEIKEEVNQIEDNKENKEEREEKEKEEINEFQENEDNEEINKNKELSEIEEKDELPKKEEIKENEEDKVNNDLIKKESEKQKEDEEEDEEYEEYEEEVEV